MGVVEWRDGYPTGFPFPAWKLPDGEVEQIVSNKGRVKDKLAAESARIYSKAQTLLEVRRNHKNAVKRSFVYWEKPNGTKARKLDHRIHLAVDPSIDPLPGEEEYDYNARSNIAAAKIAWAIEHGHKGRGNVAGEIGRKFQQDRRYPGKWILHDASGLRKGRRVE